MQCVQCSVVYRNGKYRSSYTTCTVQGRLLWAYGHFKMAWDFELNDKK